MGGTEIETLLLIAAALALAGAATGVLAGLFGVGGGAILVPVLYEVFGILDVPEAVRMPLAVGTSLAIIVPTAIQSARGHHARGAVDMALVRAWAVPVVLGVLAGSVIARFAPAALFQIVFVVVAGVNAVKMFLGRDDWRIAPDMPGGWAARGYGAVTGLFSALMGIGGGQIANLILTLHGRPIRQAVATSAAIGVLVSIPGALGYIWAGWGKAGLPIGSVGYVSLIAFAVIVPMTVLTTRFGVALAHSIPKRRLEVLFAAFLTVVCLRFLWALAS